MKDTSYIKGVSTVNFKEVAKKRIFSSINQSKLTALKILRNAFTDLKNKIGKIPYLYDFVTNHSIDPVVIVDKTNCQHLILSGKRRHEVILIDMLLKQNKVNHDDYLNELLANGCSTDEETLDSAK